jgi:amidase
VPDTKDRLAFAGVAGSLELLRSGAVTPRELVEECLQRIDALDPELNAFRKVLADRALAEADQAAGRLGAGDERPLLGLPIAVKDDSGVAGEVLGFGSNAHGGPEPADWEIVRRLRAAGAIVIGITNVPELLIFPFTETATRGITRNPWDLQRTPGGSSGGSAAAVAAGLVPAATASDGGGSIRIPAACCGLVGLKPEHDRIPPKPPGTGEAWQGLSAVGFVARTVTDTALLYGAVTGEPWPAAAEREPGRLRIALSFKVPPGLVAKVDPEVRRGVEDIADLLRSLGHEVVERDPDYGQAALNWSARYFRGIYDDATAMAHPDRLEPRTKSMARLGRLLGGQTIARARAAQATDAARINAIFDDVDVILGPGTATLPPPVGRWTGAGALRTFGGVSRFVPFNAVWNHTGNPAMTFPSGWSSQGVPLSAQIVGAPRAEETLVSLAAQVERARPWADRHPPFADAA